MAVEYCGGHMVLEWRCTECGGVWQTAEWHDHLPYAPNPTRPCPFCEKNEDEDE